jgi:adenylate cyclase
MENRASLRKRLGISGRCVLELDICPASMDEILIRLIEGQNPVPRKNLFCALETVLLVDSAKQSETGLPEGERRLAAIMFTDMVGYVALTQSDESLAMRVLVKHNQLLRPFFHKFHGKEVKSIGDSFLVEFESVLDAVKCAVELQSFLHDYSLSSTEEWKIKIRIGIHLGDVIHQDRDVFGDAVNIASRIEPVAEPEGVCITEQVYDQIHNKFELPFISRGEKSLKNVAKPVGLYTIQMPWKDRSDSTALDVHRIAVLPFANMSPDPNDSYFADGITEEIISTVSNITGLSVISRTSVMGYKGTTKKVGEIGAELDVGSVLEGSLRKAGNKIRVSAQLIAVSRDRHVWSQTYDRNLDDVFSVQSDIAKHVSDALRVKIMAEEIERIDRRPTQNTKAYTFYLRGRYHWNKREIEDIKKAREYFDLAVQEDSNFALGYIGLADCALILASNWDLDKTANLERAKSMIDQALDRDGNLAEAHATRGLMLYNEFRLTEAEEEFKASIRSKPSYASAYQWYSHLLQAQLRWDEALRNIERASELDPLSQITTMNLAYYYHARRDYEKSVDLYRKALELDPSKATPHMILAWAYGWAKMYKDARREWGVWVKLTRDSYPYVEKIAEARIAYSENDKQTLRALLPQIEAVFGQPFAYDAMEIAGLYFCLGEIGKGFEWLERSYSRRESSLESIKSIEYFDFVRTDPRYVDIVKRLGLLESSG